MLLVFAYHGLRGLRFGGFRILGFHVFQAALLCLNEARGAVAMGSGPAVASPWLLELRLRARHLLSMKSSKAMKRSTTSGVFWLHHLSVEIKLDYEPYQV